MHGSKESSCMVKRRGREAKGAPGWKGLVNPVNGFLAFGSICSEPEFQQRDSRDEAHNGSIAAQDPFCVQACAQEIDQDIGVEEDLPDYR